MWGSANQNQGNLPNFGSSNSNKQLLDKYSALSKKEQSHEAMLNKHQNDTLRDSVSPLENENNRYPSNEFNNNNNDPNSTSLPSNNATYGSSVLPDSSQNSIASISNGGVSNTIDQTSSSSSLNNNNNNIGGTINSTNDQNSLPVNHMIDPKNNIENGNVEDEEMKIQKMREAEKKRREEYADSSPPFFPFFPPFPLPPFPLPPFPLPPFPLPPFPFFCFLLQIPC